MKKEIICGIYIITSPSGKTYIGKSKDIYFRWNYYKILKCKKQIKLYRSLFKHGVENHKFEIICKCEEYQLNYLEMYLIRFYDTFNTLDGLNLRSGGEGGQLSSETKDKISKANKGKQSRLGTKLSKEHKEAISRANKDRTRKPLSQETKEKIGKANKGKKQKIEDIIKRVEIRKRNGSYVTSKETKEKLSKAGKGRKWEKPNPFKGKKRIGISPLIGIKLSKEHKEAIGNANRGKKRTQPSYCKGKKQTVEHIRKMVETRRKNNSYVTSKETKEKLSKSVKEAKARIKQERLTMIF